MKTGIIGAKTQPLDQGLVIGRRFTLRLDGQARLHSRLVDSHHCVFLPGFVVSNLETFEAQSSGHFSLEA